MLRQQLLMFAPVLDSEQIKIGLGNLKEYITLMRASQQDIAVTLALVISSDWSDKNIRQGFLEIPFDFTMPEFFDYIDRNQGEIEKFRKDGWA